MKKLLSLTFVLILLDQVIKNIVVNLIPLNYSIKVISSFFYLTYAQNIGAAWSILSGKRLLLIIISFIILGVVYFLFIRNKKLSNYEIILYSMLLSGIMGNLIDRIIRGYVIDYLDFYIFNYDYPIFNLADMLIVISIVLMFFTLKGEKNDNGRN